jgi:hypothetical protein
VTQLLAWRSLAAIVLVTSGLLVGILALRRSPGPAATTGHPSDDEAGEPDGW